MRPAPAAQAVAGLGLRPETPADIASVRELHRAAFGGDKVAELADALRSAPAALSPISLVAIAETGAVVGHVLLSACRLDAPARLVDVMTLSPLAVAEPFRRRGVGGWLIASALAAAEAAGVPLVFLEGSPAYYAAHGFEPAIPLGFRPPSLRIPEPAFQVARLATAEDWMVGSFVYSETFWALDCVGLR